MELKQCPRCKREIHPLSKECPYCKLSFEDVQIDDAAQEEFVEIELDDALSADDFDQSEEYYPEQEELSDDEVFYREDSGAKKTRFRLPFALTRRNIIIASCTGGAVLLALIVTLVFALRPSALDRARTLLNKGEYLSALSAIEGQTDAGASSLRDQIYNGMSAEVSALITNGEYAKARALIDDYKMLPTVGALTSRLQGMCTHDYESRVLRESTCTENGSSQNICKICGKTDNAVIVPAGHTYDEKVETEATCTSTGKMVKTCRGCGKTMTETIAALGHDALEASCEKDSTCRRCGITLKSADGHDASEATCEEASVCKKCNKTIAPALSHDVSTADCEHASTCKRCGKQFAPALGHDAPEADCEHASVCKRCKKTIAPALGHDAPAADCEHASVCKRCKKTVERELGHDLILNRKPSSDPNNPEYTYGATCTDPSKCSRCGQIFEKPLGHTLIDGRCTRCGEEE